jgi:hypothetical protein
MDATLRARRRRRPSRRISSQSVDAIDITPVDIAAKAIICGIAIVDKTSPFVSVRIDTKAIRFTLQYGSWSVAFRPIVV